MDRKMLTADGVMPRLAARVRGGLIYERGKGARQGENVRECEFGAGVSSMLTPAVLGVLRHKPVFTDTREGRTWFFTLDGEGCLRAEASANAAGVVRAGSDEVLATLPAGDCSAGASGRFLVVLDGSGSLHYLKWNRAQQRYSRAESLPRPERVDVTPCQMATVSADVEEVTFRTALDPREGVDSTSEQRMLEAVERACSHLDSLARESGLYTTPVTVRVGVRLWDGTLLSLGAPQMVHPIDYLQNGRVMLTPHTAGGEVTGTERKTLTLYGYRLHVDMEWAASTIWNEIVKEVEVWAVPSAASTDSSRTGRVTYAQSSGAFSVVRPVLTAEEMLERLLTAEPECVLRAPVCSLSRDVRRPVSATAHAVWTDGRARLLTGAGAIAGHGGFLHVAAPRYEGPTEVGVSGLAGATEECICRVTASVMRDEGEVLEVTEQNIHADGGRLRPLLWYPDRRAVRMRVALMYGHGVNYEHTYDLRPAPSGEDAAVYAATSEYLQTEMVGAPTPPAADVPLAADETMPGKLVTMKRGNPLVEMSATDSLGGEVRAIAAQPHGGGAYTRQFVYAFTDAGVVGVTHDMNGRHTNARPLGQGTVSGPHRVAATEQGVFALTDGGTLQRLRDARVLTLCRGLAGYTALTAAAWYGELWLTTEDNRLNTLVIGYEEADRRRPTVSESTVRADAVLMRDEWMYLASYNGSTWMLQSYGPPAGATSMDSVWVSPVMTDRIGGPAQYYVEMSGQTDATVELRLLPAKATADAGLAASEQGVVLASVKVDGRVDSFVSGACLLPWCEMPLCPERNLLQIVVRGRFECIAGAGIALY